MIRASVRIDDVRDDRFQLLRLHWEGRISGTLGGTAELIVAEHATMDPDALVGRRLTLEFVEDAEHREGSMPTSVIRAISQDYDLSNGLQILRVTLEPPFMRLSVEERCCTYGDKTVREIVTEVLERNGLSEGRDFAFRLGDEGYRPIPFVAQFDESDLAFVQRLAEHWGLSIGLEPRAGGSDVVVFADDPRAFSAIPAETLPYVDSGYRFGVTRLRRDVNALPAEVVLQNYVHDRPEQALRVVQKVAFGTAGRQIEHDHDFRSTDQDGRLLATIRAEALSCRRVVFSGEAASAALRAGQLCTVTGHPVWGDVRLLVTSVVLDFENAPLMQGASEIPVLTIAFTAMPLDLEGMPLRYRPERTMPKPRIHGVLHGLVEDSGDRLNRQIDAEGSYRVQLLAHGSDRGPVRALYPRVRMAQPAGGAGAGMHFPLHPGTEVLLAFVDGDPDRPFICGTVPNPRDRSPVDERTATKNILQTAAGSRLELDDGLLTAASGGAVSGDGIAGKLHVPYEASRTGSYLRLGRADDREGAESRAPAPARDGWYDFTNGGRTSVTMGESVLVRGGQSTEHQHGDYFRFEYPAALSPLAPSDRASNQAGADSASTGGGQAMQAASTDQSDVGSPKMVYGSYEGLLGSHYSTVSRSHTSSYVIGSVFGYTGGAKYYATAGASINDTLGIALSRTLGVKLDYDLSIAASYTGSYKYAVTDGDTFGLAKTKTETASEKIEYSVRAPANAEAMLKTQRWLRNVASVLVVTSAAEQVGVGATMVGEGLRSDDLDWVTTMDRIVNIGNAAVNASALLTAIVVACARAGAAKNKLAEVLGTGARLTLTPERGTLMAGQEVVPGEVAVAAAGAVMRRGPAVTGSMIRASQGEAVVKAGSASFIKVTPTGIQMSAGGASLVISGGRITANAAFEVEAPRPLAPPADIPGL